MSEAEKFEDSGTIEVPVETPTGNEKLNADFKRIGEGGMSIVYQFNIKNSDDNVDKSLAIKQINTLDPDRPLGQSIKSAEDFARHAEKVGGILNTLNGKGSVSYPKVSREIELSGNRKLIIPPGNEVESQIVMDYVEGEICVNYLAKNKEKLPNVAKTLMKGALERFKVGVFGYDPIDNFIVKKDGSIEIIDSDLSLIVNEDGSVEAPPIKLDSSKIRFVHPHMLKKSGQIFQRHSGGELNPNLTKEYLAQIEAYAHISWCFQKLTNNTFPYRSVKKDETGSFVDDVVFNPALLELSKEDDQMKIYLAASKGGFISFEEFNVEQWQLSPEKKLALYNLFQDSLARKDGVLPEIKFEEFIAKFTEIFPDEVPQVKEAVPNKRQDRKGLLRVVPRENKLQRNPRNELLRRRQARA